MSYANVRHDCRVCEYQLDILTRYYDVDEPDFDYLDDVNLQKYIESQQGYIDEIVICGGKRKFKTAHELWQFVGLGERCRTIA